MFLVSGPRLVIESCKAGIIGGFPTLNCRTLEDLDGWMEQISEGVAGQPDAAPWLVNIVVHSSNTRIRDDLDLIARYKPTIVSTALGHPGLAIEAVHSYGGLVFTDVIDLKLARKAIAAGVDGLILVAAGAGGHTGFYSPFAFVAAIREFFDGPLIVGGGLSDGAAVAGAIAMGADLVCMGTRFIAANESIADAEHKRLVLDGTLEDVVVTSGITGTPVSWLKASLRNAGYDPDNMPAAPARNYDSNAPAKKRWKEIFAAGQGLSSIHRTEPVSAIVDKLEAEFVEAILRLRGMTLPAPRQM